MAKSNDRRRNARINIKQKIYCKDEQAFRTLYMTNLSKGGMFIKTPYPPPLGTMMRLALALPGQDHEIEFVGKVVQSQPFGVGVQFMDMCSDDMLRMETFLNNQQAQESSPFILQGNLHHSFSQPLHQQEESKHQSSASLSELLLEIENKTYSGVLHLTRDNEFRRIQIRNGVPVDITSSNFNENFCLGRLLKRAGQISKHDLHATLVEMEQTGKKQGTILLERGLLTWEQIQKGLEWQLTIKLDELLHWNRGQYHFVREEIESDANWVEPELDLAYAIFKSLYRQAQHQPDVLLQKLCNYENYAIVPQALKRHSGGHRQLFSTTKEVQMWHYIVHCQSSLQDLLQKNEFDATQLRAFVLALSTAGLVSITANSSSTSTDFQNAWQQQLLSPNYFERLNLPWTCADKQIITQAHQKLLHNLSEEMASQYKENINEAYQTLINDYQRRDYRKHVIGQEEMHNMADQLYRLGKMKVHHGHYQHAYPLLLSATDLNPGTPEYHQWLERAKVAETKKSSKKTGGRNYGQ